MARNARLGVGVGVGLDWPCAQIHIVSNPEITRASRVDCDAARQARLMSCPNSDGNRESKTRRVEASGEEIHGASACICSLHYAHRRFTRLNELGFVGRLSELDAFYAQSEAAKES
jgi:hypothetical protein